MTSPFVVRHMVESALVGREKAIKSIDPRPHFLPFDVETLKLTLAHKLVNKYRNTNPDFAEDLKTNTEVVEKLYEHIASYVETGKKPVEQHGELTTLFPYKLVQGPSGFLQTKDLGTIIDDRNVKEHTPAAVYNKNGQLVGVLVTGNMAAGNAFNALGNTLFASFLNNAYIKRYLKGGYTSKRDKGFDIGHIGSATTELGMTPSKYQADTVISNLTQAISKEKDPVRLDTLRRVHRNISHMQGVFINEHHGPELEKLTFFKEFGPGLAKISANIVIAQDREENQGAFGTEEGRLISAISAELKNINFSRNLLQEIAHQVLSIFTGKKVASSKTKLEVPVQKKQYNKIKVPSGKIHTPGPLRSSDTGRFVKTSPTSLLSIINFHLHDVVAANMGDGSERRILNYRTGRFATSTKAVSVSISRDDMISVFYTYMKNPYATFSEGGTQQYPKTRDPKILISQSIRQIAERLVSNRIRSVVV